MQTDPKETILAFARHVGRADGTPPEDIARRRNWLGPGGDVTEEGRALLAALGDQDGTRTVFRGNF
jgi:hypothetical protein